MAYYNRQGKCIYVLGMSCVSGFRRFFNDLERIEQMVTSARHEGPEKFKFFGVKCLAGGGVCGTIMDRRVINRVNLI